MILKRKVKVLNPLLGWEYVCDRKDVVHALYFKHFTLHACIIRQFLSFMFKFTNFPTKIFDFLKRKNEYRLTFFWNRKKYQLVFVIQNPLLLVYSVFLFFFFFFVFVNLNQKYAGPNLNSYFARIASFDIRILRVLQKSSFWDFMVIYILVHCEA